MLYKAPGPHEIHGGKYDYVIVEDDAVEEAIADGWFLTTPEAKDAYMATQVGGVVGASVDERPEESTAPTRAELEQKAEELGIKVDGRWSDKKVAWAIADKLKE